MCVLGYSLQFLSQSDASRSPSKGDWMSKEISMTNDRLCVSLDLSVPAIFHVSVELLTNSTRKTVYTVENVVGETLPTDIVTIFEVEVDTRGQSGPSQFVVTVSEGTLIRKVDIQNEQCDDASKFITQYIQKSDTLELLYFADKKMTKN